MRLIIITLIIAALGLYIYIDYDHVKQMITGEKPVTPQTPVESVKPPEPPATPVTIQKEELQTKFKADDVVFINAAAGDFLGFSQKAVSFWITYDGSELDEDGKQRILEDVPHRTEVRVIKFAKGRKGLIWYYVRTSKGFPLTGWVEEKYLSKEIPDRREGQVEEDWGR